MTPRVRVCLLSTTNCGLPTADGFQFSCLMPVARFDEAGKQLITIGSTLQTLYIALFITTHVMDRVSRTSKVSISVCLWLVIVLAGFAVCSVQVDTEVLSTFNLFAKLGRSNSVDYSADGELRRALNKWCTKLRRTVLFKRVLLIFAKISLVGALGIVMWVLSNAI